MEGKQIEINDSEQIKELSESKKMEKEIEELKEEKAREIFEEADVGLV